MTRKTLLKAGLAADAVTAASSRKALDSVVSYK
jgi:hypothetical protein